MLTVRNPSGYDLFFDRVTQEESAITRMDLGQGTYVLKIEAQFYQNREFEIMLPLSDAAHSIDLEPDYTYPFPAATLSHVGRPALLRGTVHAADGSGLEDVTVEVTGGSNDYLTDKTGQWVLIFPEDQTSGEVAVRFTFPDDSIVNVPAVAIVEGQESSLTQAGLRGWVVNGAGVGIAGVVVQAAGHAGETVSADDGSWSFYFDLNQTDELVSVTATLSDGQMETQHNVQVRFRAIEQGPNFLFQ